MEASEANDRDEEEACHTHDGHAGPLRPMAVGKNMEQVPVNKPFPPPPNQGWPPTPWGLPGSQPTLHPEPQFPLWNVPPAHTVFVVRPRIRDGSVGGSQSLSVVQHIDQAKGDDTHHVCAE